MEAKNDFTESNKENKRVTTEDDHSKIVTDEENSLNPLCDRVLISLSLMNDALQDTDVPLVLCGRDQLSDSSSLMTKILAHFSRGINWSLLTSQECFSTRRFHEFLEFKDEMQKHDLPGPLLIHIAHVARRLFTSLGELSKPVGELVRLVHIQSVLWKEKSTELSKLHDCYQSKQRELDIAIRRLQLVDQQSQRMAREKRILNWEKLFAKVATAKGHGRRWKFNVETIKQKAKLGLEHIKAYSQVLEELSDSDEKYGCLESSEAGEDQISLKTQDHEDEKTQNSESVINEMADNFKTAESIVLPELPGNTEAVNEAAMESTAKVIFIAQGHRSQVPGSFPHIGRSQLSSQTRTTSENLKVEHCENSHTPAILQPSTQDAETWTHEPEFDQSLFVRIFCPEGLQQRDLKCSLAYHRTVLKTPVLDRTNEETHDTNKGIIERPHAARKVDSRAHHNEFSSTSRTGPGRRKGFCEFEIQLTDELKQGQKSALESETLKFAVHHGRFEEVIAVASVACKDIKQMNLETVYLPPLHEDDLDVPCTHSRTSSFSASSNWNSDYLADTIGVPGLTDDSSVNVTMKSSLDKLLNNCKPQLYPLYSSLPGKLDAVQMPCGSLPLLIFWGKRPRPAHLNKQCGTSSVNDLVYAMTGIDITTSQNKLPKEMVDVATSVTSPQPEDKEEMVSQSEYHEMVQQHQKELASLRQQYELQVGELTELISNLQTMQYQDVNTHQPDMTSLRPAMVARAGTKTPVLDPSSSVLSGSSISHVSAHSQQLGSREPTTAASVEENVSLTSSISKHRHPISQGRKSARVSHLLPCWGKQLPHDLFERLRLWEEESKHHKQELHEKTLKEIKDNLERKLTCQYKLSRQEEPIYDALQDVNLPALFMPCKKGHVYNPRAHHYFHPTGVTDKRLTQPPSVFQLTSLPKHTVLKSQQGGAQLFPGVKPVSAQGKLSAVNLFQMSKNFHIQGPPWLLDHYTELTQSAQQSSLNTAASQSGLTQVFSSEQDFLHENY